MQKIQILFPDPLMRRMRQLAEMEDRPVSEVVRRAVERFVEQSPTVSLPVPCTRRLPTFKGGRMLAGSGEMKEILYADHE